MKKILPKKRETTEALFEKTAERMQINLARVSVIAITLLLLWLLF